MPNTTLQRIRQFFGLEPRFTAKDPELNRLFSLGARTLAGPVVNEFTAFACAAFYDGVNQLSSDVAKLPLNLHKHRSTGGGSDIMIRHPVHRLMKFAPNPETQSIEFRRLLQMWALVYGNGYAEIVRDGLGQPRELWPIHPRRVVPFYDDGGGRPRVRGPRAPLRYRIDGEVILEPRDVLHIRGLSDDAVTGLGLVGVAREALGLCLASSQFASSFFGHGTRFGGVLSSDQDLDEDQKAEIMASIESLHSKADQAFRLLILGAGFQYQASGTNPTDAQMTELRDQQVMEIARFLNMPLYKLKLNTPGAVSYNSVEMASLDYYKGPILTWVTVWEQELLAKLIPRLEWGIEFFRHNVDGFLRGDNKSRQEALAIQRSHGIITANQWLDMLDMNPQDGPQGDMYLVQGAQVPADRLGDLVDAQTAPPPAPVVAEPEPDDEDEDEDRIAALMAELETSRIEASEIREQLAAESAKGQAEIDTLQVSLKESEARADAVQAAVAAERAARDKDEDRIAELLAELESSRSEAAEIREQLASESANGQAELQTLHAALAASEARADAVQAAVVAEQAARDDVTDQLRALEQSEAARAALVVEAHRALVRDVVGRLTRLDCEQARRKQATPDKLEKWLSGYPTLKRDAYAEALEPALRAHAVWAGHDYEPKAARALALRHLDALTQCVKIALEGDGDDYHAVLDQSLRDLESDWPGMLAKEAIHDRIRHDHVERRPDPVPPSGDRDGDGRADAAVAVDA